MLLEVLISLMIAGFAMTAIMRSLTMSLSASRTLEQQTQAQFFAGQLLHELQLFPPEAGQREGGFGDDYKNYSFRTTVSYERPRYRKLDGASDVERFFAMRQLTIEIFYQDEKHKPVRLLQVDSALPGFEKFTVETKQSYKQY